MNSHFALRLLLPTAVSLALAQACLASEWPCEDLHGNRTISVGKLVLTNITDAEIHCKESSKQTVGDTKVESFTLTIANPTAHADVAGNQPALMLLTKALTPGAQVKETMAGFGGPLLRLNLEATLIGRSGNVVGLTIPADGLSFIVLPRVFKSTPLNGGKFRVPQTEFLSVTNTSDLVLRKKQSAGDLAFDASKATWSKPEFRLPGISSPVTAALNASGAASFRYSLANSRVTLEKGNFAASGVPLGRTTKVSRPDLVDLLLTDALIARLSASVDMTSTQLRLEGFRAPADAMFWARARPTPAIGNGVLQIGVARASVSRSPLPSDTTKPEVAGFALVPNGPEDCAARTVELTAFEQEALRGRALFSPAIQRSKALEEARKALASMGSPEFVIHLPKADVIELIKRRQAAPTIPIRARDFTFAEQELRQCLSLDELAVGLGSAFPVRVVMHYALATSGNELIVRPAVQLLRLPSVRHDQPILLETLLDQIQSAVEQAMGSFDPNDPEFHERLPLEMSYRLAFNDPQHPELTVQTNGRTFVVSAVKTAVLVDTWGAHLMGTVEQK
jgi:hypothetical protein